MVPIYYCQYFYVLALQCGPGQNDTGCPRKYLLSFTITPRAPCACACATFSVKWHLPRFTNTKNGPAFLILAGNVHLSQPVDSLPSIASTIRKGPRLEPYSGTPNNASPCTIPALYFLLNCNGWLTCKPRAGGLKSCACNTFAFKHMITKKKMAYTLVV